jgi:hypothetical protein
MGKTHHANFTRFYFYVIIPENPSVLVFGSADLH